MSANPFEPAVPIEETPIARKKPPITLVEFLVVVAIIGVLVGLLMPAVRTARPAARRMQCSNNLKMIGLAMQNYHNDYGQFPPAYTVDSEGNRLHSWRTLLLPYLEQQALYEKIDLSKPWNDPTNMEVYGEHAPMCFVCPCIPNFPSHRTSYLVLVDPHSCFPGERSIGMKDITDGTSNTLLVMDVPVGCEVDWMSPNDTDLSLLTSINEKTELLHRDVFQAVFADGSVHALSNDSPPSLRVELMTINNNDPVDLDKLE